jgi:hypothetical protein
VIARRRFQKLMELRNLPDLRGLSDAAKGEFQVFRIVMLVMVLAVYVDGAGAEAGKDELGKSRWREDYTRYNDGYGHLFELEAYRDWVARQAAKIPRSQLPPSIECPQLQPTKAAC